MTFAVKRWKYARPPGIPDDLTDIVYPCGCGEYEEDGVWWMKQCPKHKQELKDRLKRRQLKP